MRVPNQLLRDIASVREYGGSGARGPIFGDARAVRCSIQMSQREVVDAKGVTVTIDTLIIIRPEDGPVAAESLITTTDLTFRVVRCYAMPDERRPSQYELAVVRYAS